MSYTRAHFASEERIMEQNGYPDIAAHRKEHGGLTEKVLEFQRDFDAGRVGMGVDLMQSARQRLNVTGLAGICPFMRRAVLLRPS